MKTGKFVKRFIGAMTGAFLGIIGLLIVVPASPVKGDTASPVELRSINYETLELTLKKNGNSVIYFSTDSKKTFNEIEGAKTEDTMTMDISWASAGSNVTVYFKGNVDPTVLKVTLPKQATNFKVQYDKVDGEFSFTGNDDRSYFYYRKSTDYNWKAVSFNDTLPSDVPGCIRFSVFEASVEALRFKGTKLVLRLGQKEGTADDFGERPSKEVTVTIPKYAIAPSVKINLTKLNFNTKTTMEYSKDNGNTWSECENNMTLLQLAPETQFGSASVILIRTAATEKKAVSLTQYLLIPAVGAEPVKNTDYEVSYQAGTKAGTFSTLINFKTASKDQPLEYSICKEGSFDASTARWTSVNSVKTVKLSNTQAPKGSVIYIRFKGIAENATKGNEMKLPSAYTNFAVLGN